jgi:hypothetical protein
MKTHNKNIALFVFVGVTFLGHSSSHVQASVFARPVVTNLQFVVTMGTQCGDAVMERSVVAGNTNAILPMCSSRKVYMEALKTRTQSILPSFTDTAKASGGKYDQYFAQAHDWRWITQYGVSSNGGVVAIQTNQLWVFDVHPEAFPMVSLKTLVDNVTGFPRELVITTNTYTETVSRLVCGPNQYLRGGESSVQHRINELCQDLVQLHPGPRFRRMGRGTGVHQ